MAISRIELQRWEPMLSYGDPRTRIRALVCRLLGTPDYARWSNPAHFDDWEDRTRAIAALIHAGSRVVEFGAGSGLLQRYLPRDCTYVACDLFRRDADTIVFDLNGDLPDLGGGFDVAVFAGVLEYVRSIPTLLKWIAGQSDRVIASYCYARTPARSLSRLLEHYSRAGDGWVNSYSRQELIDAAARAGLVLRRTVQHDAAEGESIFEFEVAREGVGSRTREILDKES
jgi:hypothetical protein